MIETVKKPVNWTLVGLAIGLMALVVVMPLVAVLAQAFSDGLGGFFRALAQRETRSAIWLTLTVVAIAVPLNVIFGIAAGWALTRFRFPGRGVLMTLIDVPFTLSPVVSGLLLVLLFGSRGMLGPWLQAEGIRVLFALPGLVLATVLVTLPFVAREVIAVMSVQGSEEEQTAATLGARGWATLWHITLPNIRWGLFHGTLLCLARALGEFGAVSVVSGSIRGRTTTLPLEVEELLNGYDFSAAFAAASLLALVGIVSIVTKRWIEGQREYPHGVVP